MEHVCIENYRGSGKRLGLHYNGDSISPQGRYYLSGGNPHPRPIGPIMGAPEVSGGSVVCYGAHSG